VKFRREYGGGKTNMRNESNRSQAQAAASTDFMQVGMKGIAYAIVGIIVVSSMLGFFGESSPDSKNSPSINWSDYAAHKKISIEKSIKEGSCIGLQKAFGASSKSEILGYIDWHLNKLGCSK
jgi:hypothetical protein